MLAFKLAITFFIAMRLCKAIDGAFEQDTPASMAVAVVGVLCAFGTIACIIWAIWSI